MSREILPQSPRCGTEATIDLEKRKELIPEEMHLESEAQIEAWERMADIEINKAVQMAKDLVIDKNAPSFAPHKGRIF